MVAICAVGFLAGCAKNPTISPLFPPSPPTRFYVANFSDHLVVAYTLPLGGTSTPAFTLTTSSTGGGIVADAANNLYVPSGTNILVYAQPVKSTSTPTTIGPIAGAGSFRGAAIDRAGNLWVVDATGKQIFQFTLPLVSATPLRVLQCACFTFPFSVTFDRGGHIFVADDGGFVAVLNVPAAAGTTVGAAVAIIAAPGASGIAADAANRLFVADFAGGEINIFTPPFATGNTPSDSLFPPGTLTTPEQMLFDSAGNLYVAYNSDTTLTPTGGVAIFGPPVNGSSFPSLTLQGTVSGLTDPQGVAFAP